MIVTIVEVYVKEENINDFITETIKNHQGSIQEKGNLRFDVLQSQEDPCRFTLYEAYESKNAAAAHKQTKHYLTWRKNVQDWMAKDRVGIAHQVIAPKESKLW